MRTFYQFVMLAMMSYTVSGQELIQNGSFENIASGHTFSSSQGNFGSSDIWKSRTNMVNNNPLHSPDLNWSGHQTFPLGYYGITPHRGEKYIDAASGNFELFYQNVSALSGGYYILSGWIRADTSYNSHSDCPNCGDFYPVQKHDNKISFYLGKNEFEFKSENSSTDEDNCTNDYKSLKSNDILTFDYYFDFLQLYERQQWIPIELPINISDNDKGWLGILYGGTDYPYCMDNLGENGDFLNFDDISLRKASCYCPLEEWIQNMDYDGLYAFTSYYIPESGKIQASEAIKAGYDVGIFNPHPGNVIVENGVKITYQAGNNIQLLPGFEVKPGGIFTAQIGPCEYQTSAISLISYPTFFVPSYTGSGYPNIFGFIASGATDYTLHVYGRNGQQDINTNGQVPSNGRVLIDNSYWDGYYCDETYVFFLTLSNCGETQNYEHSTQLWCLGDYKTQPPLLDSVNSDFQINIYPNPSNGVVNFDITSNQKLENITMKFFDAYGKVLKEDLKITCLGNSISKTIDISDLADGIYQVEFNVSGKIYTKRVVKN